MRILLRTAARIGNADAVQQRDRLAHRFATARAAVFGRWALRTLPPEEHARYFVLGPSVPGIAREGSFTLRPEFRRMVRFERQNLMSLIVNLAAASVYLVAHFVLGVEIVWLATAAIAVGALVGGYFGAHLAKKMPEWLLRGIIVVVALFALVRQVV